MKRDKLCVAVSGLHLGENAQPGAGVIRSLRDAFGSAVTIVGLAYDALDSSLYATDLLDDAFLVPYPSAGPERYLQRLVEIDTALAIDLLIPCLDVELPVLKHLAADLAKRGVHCLLPGTRSLSACRKDRLSELADRLHLRVPETLRIADWAGLEAAGARLGYPFVVKGPFYEAEVVHGPDQAASAYHRLSQAWGLPLIGQRFVRGDEYNVAALGDGKGSVHAAVAMRKTIVTRLGKAWGAMTVLDADVLAFAEHVIRGLSWLGPCEIELLKDTDGTLYLIEVNPRFPAWIYLATAAGCNMPQALACMALGAPVPEFEPYRAGVFFVRHAVEALGSVADLEQIASQGRRSSAPPPPDSAVLPRPLQAASAALRQLHQRLEGT